MTRTNLAVLFAATAIAAATLSIDGGSARDAGRKRPAEKNEPPLSSLSADALKHAFVGTWNDERHRWWFTIDELTDDQVRHAQFRLAHLKAGQVRGNRLALVSTSCVPLVGCYDYKIDGTLLTPSRMDMHATDESGDTVHFVLVRQ